MSAVVRILISDQLLAEYDDDRWPACLDLLQREPAGGPLEHPGASWWLVRDSGAPADLDGKRIEFSLSLAAGQAVITSRREIR